MFYLDKARQMSGVFWSLVKKPYWLQVISKCEASWPSQVEVADWVSNIPVLQDDGLHFDKSPFYFEWWYFDATFGDGSTVSIIFHFRDLINPLSSDGSVNVAVFDQGNPVFRRFMPYPTNQIDAAKKMCDVRIGKNRCWLDNNKYRIKIDEPDIKAELVFESDSIGWRPGNGKINFGDEKAFFAWIVPQPKANVNGYVVINGEETKLSGVGYHDHNWGTVSLLDTVIEWSWGRIYLDDKTCIFADIQLSPHYGGARMLPFSILHGSHVLISSFLQNNCPLDTNSDFLRNPKSVELPEGWHFQWNEANDAFNLILKTQHVLEKSDLLPGKSFRQKIIEKLLAHPYYIRCYVTAKGQWKSKDHIFPLEGYGIYEQITFGR